MASEAHRTELRWHDKPWSWPAPHARRIESLVVKMAVDNFGWGYSRILGALSNLGHSLARGTIANI
jgi:hypothetical protein